MSERSTSRAPLITSIVLGVVALVLAAALVGLVIDRRSASGGLGLTNTEQQVLDAARQEYLTLQTFRRKSFDADFANASAALTGSALSQLQQSKSGLKSRLTTQQIDTSATITSASIVNSTQARYEVLILASVVSKNDAGKTVAAAKPSPATLVMVRKGGRWLISEVNLVDVAGAG